MAHRTLLFLTFSLLIASCNTPKKTQAQEHVEPSSQELKPQIPEKEIAINEDLEIECRTASLLSETQVLEDDKAVKILSARKQGQTLFLKFQYSGCNEGKPLLLLDKANRDALKKEDKAQFTLLVRGSGECEMLIETEECFDLKSLDVGYNRLLLKINENFQAQL